jgi:capsular polysaccharide biosynthesis protein
MGLVEYFHVIRRRWVIVVLAVLLCGGAAGAYASTIPTTYTATTRLYVSMATGTSVNDSYQGGLAAQQRIMSYSYLPKGINVAQRVVADLGLRMSPAELQGKISVTSPPATMLLDISVTDSTPEGARLLADKVAAQFRRLITQVETTVVGAAPAAQATVIDPAQTPTQPSSPTWWRLVTIGLLGGLAAGGLTAVARDRLDGRVRTSRQVAEVLPVPVLAAVPGREPETSREIGRLRMHLTSSQGGPDPATLLLTSFSGRSTPGVALNLSKALARTGRRVALVDADTTGEGVSVSLGMISAPGVAECLRTPQPPFDELLRFSEEGIGLVALGAVDDCTSDQLSSTRFAELISYLKVRFDYVLVDGAPLAADASALALSSSLGRTLAVVQLGSTSVSSVRASAVSFEQSGSGLIGAVVVTPPTRKERRRQRRREPLPEGSQSLVLTS